MITLEECVAFCGLTEEEVLAIAVHEHIPEIAATALADYLIHHEHGIEKIQEHVLTLLHVLHHFSGRTRRRDQNSIPWSDCL